MDSLGENLTGHAEGIVNNWFTLWSSSHHPHPEVTEVDLKDSLESQIKLIGSELQKGASAEPPDKLWQKPERLDPEVRVEQEIPIEELVQAYRMLVDSVRDWIQEHSIRVSFTEYSYFYEAIFQLVAESVRRYAHFQSENVAKDRSEYLAGLTHQMRTPLTALKTQVELLEYSARLGGDEIKRLRSGINRLMLLVNGVLRMERFKPAEIPVRRERLNLAALINDVVSDIEYEAMKKSLRLEVLVDRTLWLDVDPDLLWDALSNLLHNAVKYTPRGFVRLETEETVSDVCVRVRDSGPGIPQERKARIFQIQPSSSKGGMGIGLSIVHRAITAMGGSLGVEDNPGGGTIVWFRLPKLAS